jgi:hypothetical protein
MYRWNGRLVFAGPSVAVGGSESEEALELDRHPELSAGVLYLGAVSEAEKEWLLKNAALVLCPSHYEGFGLVPFEAARAGRPALTSRSTSLAEILGDQVIYLDTLNPEAGARIIWSFLSDPEVVRKQVEAIRARATAFTWSGVADRLLAFYARLLEMPPHPRVGRLDLEADNTRRFQPLRRRVVVALRIWRTAGLSTLLQKVWRRYIWLRSDVK